MKREEKVIFKIIMCVEWLKYYNHITDEFEDNFIIDSCIEELKQMNEKDIDDKIIKIKELIITKIENKVLDNFHKNHKKIIPIINK